jgi:hypothetical protein
VTYPSGVRPGEAGLGERSDESGLGGGPRGAIRLGSRVIALARSSTAHRETSHSARQENDRARETSYPARQEQGLRRETSHWGREESDRARELDQSAREEVEEAAGPAPGQAFRRGDRLGIDEILERRSHSQDPHFESCISWRLLARRGRSHAEGLYVRQKAK